MRQKEREAQPRDKLLLEAESVHAKASLTVAGEVVEYVPTIYETITHVDASGNEVENLRPYAERCGHVVSSTQS